MNTAGNMERFPDAPSPEHLRGLEVSAQFENLDDLTKQAIFEDIVRGLHHAASGGLTEEQLAARKELYEELLSDTERQIDIARNPREVTDRGDDR